MPKTLYDILLLKRYASIDEVKSAFKQMALKYHPDKNPGNDTAEERFKEVNSAYQILSNPDLKGEYDSRLSGYFQYAQKEPPPESKEAERRRKSWEAQKRKKEMEEEKIRRDFRKLQSGVPLIIRHALNYAIIGFGGSLIFSNWVHTVESFSPLSYVFGLVVILLGSIKEQNLNYTIWLYRKLEKLADINIPLRFMRNLGISVVLTVILAIGSANLLELYHFTYYPAKKMAEVKVEMVDKQRFGFQVTYEYSVEGELYKKEIPEDRMQYILPGRKVWIQYSYRNPIYSKIIPLDTIKP